MARVAGGGEDTKIRALQKISCSSRCLKFSGKPPIVPLKLDENRRGQNLCPMEKDQGDTAAVRGSGENCWTQLVSVKCQSASMWSWSRGTAACCCAAFFFFKRPVVGEAASIFFFFLFPVTIVLKHLGFVSSSQSSVSKMVHV